MALFNSNAGAAPDAPKPRGPVNPSEQHNIIGRETVIEGTLRARGNVHVSGRIEGNLEVDGRAVIMPGGVVDGEVTATHAEVGGHVKGQVTIAERLVLKATAVVEGDIRTGKLVIEDGAAFTGRCDMGTARAADARPTPDRPAASVPRHAAAPDAGPVASA